MWRRVCLLLLLWLCDGSLRQLDRQKLFDRNIHPLIYGGLDAVDGQFPFMVAVTISDRTGSTRWYCGATLISPDWVLSCAHCFDNVVASQVQLRFGSVHRTEGEERGVSLLVVHPGWRTESPSNENDLTLLRLSSPAPLGPNCAPVAIWRGYIPPNTPLTTIGFGMVENQRGVSNKLKYVVLNSAGPEECQAQHHDGNTTYMECCGGNQAGRDTCNGDSGGPAVIANPQDGSYAYVGALSFGSGSGDCGALGVWSVFTRAGALPYWNWILSTTGLEEDTLEYTAVPFGNGNMTTSTTSHVVGLEIAIGILSAVSVVLGVLACCLLVRRRNQQRTFALVEQSVDVISSAAQASDDEPSEEAELHSGHESIKGLGSTYASVDPEDQKDPLTIDL